MSPLGLSLDDINTVVSTICAIANCRTIFYLWRPAALDPDDDFLIDLAVECQADFIITYNKRDLRSTERFGIQLVTAKEFLQIVGEIES